MLRYIYSAIFILVFFSRIPIIGQVAMQGKPLYNPQTDTFHVPELVLKVPELKKQEKKGDFILKDNNFALPVDINLDPADYGIWKEFKECNTKVLLLALKADKAVSMNFILENYELLPGVRLFFYNQPQKQILGAFTSRNNKASKVLPVSLIYGDKIYVELQVPIHWKEYGSFTISRVGVETTTLYSTLKSPTDRWFNGSQSCQYNVNCNSNTNIQAHKNAVVRILFNATGRCTGTLLSNLEYNETPYVLTAAHCFNTEYIANRAVFSFNYESPSCENIDGPERSISGATVVAAGHHGDVLDSLDFLLLKLSENIPIEYEPYYSGWDATGVAPDSTFTIHHPVGDIKKLSYDYDMPITASSGSGFNDGTHWLVKDYDKGSSEVGSSGAGLVNTKNRLIGTLTGGGSPCSPIINDVYQKFSHSYSDYNDPSSQLKAWLDPQNTGQLVCNGSGLGAILNGLATIISNFDESDKFEHVQQTVGWGYLAGHNYQGNSQFAEHFNFIGSKYLYQFDFNPAAVYSSNPDQTFKFVVWKGGSQPGERIYEKQYALAEFMSINPPVYISLDSTILVSEDFYAGFEINYNADTFALNTVQTSSSLNTSYTFLNGNWKQLQLNGTNYPSHMALRAYMFDYMPKKGVIYNKEELADISIYPNPVDNQLQLLFKNLPEGEVLCKLYNLSGQLVLTKTFVDPAINLPLYINNQRGIYFLQVICNNTKPVTFKLIVL
jgi:hypothetical protein